MPADLGSCYGPRPDGENAADESLSADSSPPCASVVWFAAFAVWNEFRGQAQGGRALVVGLAALLVI